jgi:hypothetical protein
VSATHPFDGWNDSLVFLDSDRGSRTLPAARISAYDLWRKDRGEAQDDDDAR